MLCKVMKTICSFYKFIPLLHSNALVVSALQDAGKHF